jgi:predicted metal-dependent enzyme (double-stranded beta helix superfamily)
MYLATPSAFMSTQINTLLRHAARLAFHTPLPKVHIPSPSAGVVGASVGLAFSRRSLASLPPRTAFTRRQVDVPAPARSLSQAFREAETKLTGVYTPLTTPQARAVHASNQEEVAQKLAELKALPCTEGTDFRDVVAQHLVGMLKKSTFDPGIYQARSSEVGGYGRFLLHSDPKESFCLQVFAFNPRQKTPIHNHPNECASYVVMGSLVESIYETKAAAAAAGHPGRLREIESHARPEASGAAFSRDELHVAHSLANVSDAKAVSTHLYRDMDGLSPGQQVGAAEKFLPFKG